MKILVGNYIYESVGTVYTDEDVKEMLESSGCMSIEKFNSLLEAVSNVPDLEPSEEDSEIENAMQSQSSSTQVDQKDSSDSLPEDPEESLDDSLEPTDTTEVEPPEEPTAPVSDEPEAPNEPSNNIDTPTEEPEVNEEPLPEIDPPALAPKKTLPKEKLKDVEWMPNKTLGTLFTNYKEFFGGEKGMNSAGRVVGLKAPGLKQDSNYLQTDITAFIEGTEEDPYSVWIKLRRKRPTQNWSLENPCEVRCSCKMFSYFVANANLRNKSLAGPPAKNKKYRDDSGKVRTINFTLPSKVNNPSHTPALCKHLATLTQKLIDNNMITES